MRRCCLGVYRCSGVLCQCLAKRHTITALLPLRRSMLMYYLIVMSFSMSALASKPHHTPGISALLALCFAKLALGRWHGFWHIMMADASTNRIVVSRVFGLVSYCV